MFARVATHGLHSQPILQPQFLLAAACEWAFRSWRPRRKMAETQRGIKRRAVCTLQLSLEKNEKKPFLHATTDTVLPHNFAARALQASCLPNQARRHGMVWWSSGRLSWPPLGIRLAGERGMWD